MLLSDGGVQLQRAHRDEQSQGNDWEQIFAAYCRVILFYVYYRDPYVFFFSLSTKWDPDPV